MAGLFPLPAGATGVAPMRPIVGTRRGGPSCRESRAKGQIKGGEFAVTLIRWLLQAGPVSRVRGGEFRG